jgi:hypothetical protein
MVLPTFSLIKVKDVKNDCYILENGGLRAVLEVSGIHFSLLSEEEQEILIGQFKSFLDGLDFSVEILVLSRLENINDYLKVLHLRLENETVPLIKFQLEEYIAFLEDYLQNHLVMKKIFYVVIPYDSVSIKIGSSEKTDEDLKLKLEQLDTRVNYVRESINSFGLNVKRLNNYELIELLFELYNPNLRWKQIPKQLIEKLAEVL